MTYCYELIEGIAILGAFDIVEVLVILIFKIFNTLVIIYFNYLVIYLFILIVELTIPFYLGHVGIAMRGLCLFNIWNINTYIQSRHPSYRKMSRKIENRPMNFIYVMTKVSWN